MSIKDILKEADAKSTLASSLDDSEQNNPLSDEEFDAIYQSSKVTKRGASKVDTEAKVDKEIKTEVDTNTKNQTEVKVETDAKTETEVKADTDAKTETEVKADTDAKTETQVKVDTDVKTQPEVKADTDTKANLVQENKADSKSNLQKSLSAKKEKREKAKRKSENDEMESIGPRVLATSQMLFKINENDSPEAAKKAEAKEKVKDIVFKDVKDDSAKNNDFSNILKPYTKTVMRILGEKPDSVKVLSKGVIEVAHKGVKWVDDNKNVEFYVDELTDDVIKRAVDAAIGMAVEKDWKTIKLSDVHDDVKDLFISSAKKAGIAVKIENKKPSESKKDSTVQVQDEDILESKADDDGTFTPVI